MQESGELKRQLERLSFSFTCSTCVVLVVGILVQRLQFQCRPRVGSIDAEKDLQNQSVESVARSEKV